MRKLIGRMVRAPLKAIPKSATMPVLFGPNRGYKWVVGSGQHGCWIGNYERYCASVIASFVQVGMTVFDVGAHAGYYTLMLSRRIGPSGRVFSFEASPTNATNLRRHLKLNDIRNVKLVEAAVSDRSGTTLFAESGYNGRIETTGRPTATVRLDDFATPNFVKMDIEGAEGHAMLGAKNLLSLQKTTWFIALHAEPARSLCLSLLHEANYQIEWITPNEICATPSIFSD